MVPPTLSLTGPLLEGPQYEVYDMRNTVQNDTLQSREETLASVATLLSEGYGGILILLDDEGRSVPHSEYRVYGVAEWTLPTNAPITLEEGIANLQDMLREDPSTEVTLQYHEVNDEGVEHPTRC